MGLFARKVANSVCGWRALMNTTVNTVCLLTCTSVNSSTRACIDFVCVCVCKVCVFAYYVLMCKVYMKV